MIHQFFDYETIKEGFDSTDTNPADIPSTESSTPTEPIENPVSENTKLLKDVGLLVVFYILFVIIFMVSGSIMFKYIIMTRLGKSIFGYIPGLPDNLSYRKKSSEDYNKFFAGDKEALLNKEYECDYFSYTRKDEKNEKLKIFIPIIFSYKPYYNDWLYRHDFNTGIPGTIYSLDADMDKSSGEGEIDPILLSNRFPINWFWSSFTTVFTTTNNIFTNCITASVAIIIVLLLALSNTISMVSTVVNQNIYPSGFTILTSIFHSFSILIYIPIFVSSFASLFWSVNLVNFYEADKQMHLRFLRYTFFENFWLNLLTKIFAICTVFACLIAWLWFNFFLIATQFLPTVFMVMFFICVLGNTNGKYIYNDETKDLTFSNILLELFPIYCFTNRWIIFFMLFAFVLLASAINPTIGAVTFACMFFGIIIFYTSIKKMIQNILSRLTPKTLDTPLEINEEDNLSPVESDVTKQNPETIQAKKDAISLMHNLWNLQYNTKDFTNEDIFNIIKKSLKMDDNTSKKFDKFLNDKLNKFKSSDNKLEGYILINKIKDTIRAFLGKNGNENFTVEDVSQSIEDAVMKALNEVEEFNHIQNKNSNPSASPLKIGTDQSSNVAKETLQAKKDALSLMSDLTELQKTKDFTNEGVFNIIKKSLTTMDPDTNTIKKFDKNLENKLNKFKLSDNNIEGNIIINNIKDTIMDLFYKDKNFTVEDVTEGIEETVTKALNKFEDFKGIQNKNPNPSDLNPPKKNMSIVQSEPSDLKEPEEKIKKEG